MFKRTLIFIAIISSLAHIVPPTTAQESATTTFTIHVINHTAPQHITSAVLFDTPTTATDPSPIAPGQQVSVEISAAQGDVLGLATMFVESNDLFFATSPTGVALFDSESGDPISGDITDQVFLWDAGTEINESLGSGPNQAPRQAAPNSGETEHGIVTAFADENAPVVAAYLRATITPTTSIANGTTTFILTLENISAESTVPTALSAGIAITHQPETSIFVPDSAAPFALEALAENGDASLLYESFTAPRFATEIGPVIWVAQPADELLFDVGSEASLGIEALAEDGDQTYLVEEIEGLNGDYTYTTVSGYEGLAVVGDAYEFTITANPADALTFVVMLAESNDWFYGVNALPLFDDDGQPITGDRSAALRLWDAGTEVDEPLGSGPNQGLRQPAANTGPNQNGVITRLDPSFDPMQPDARFAMQLIITVAE